MAELHKTVVAAFVFIRKDETILLVKQGYGQRRWSLPGGVMEAGESIDQAAIREVKEETGLDIRLGKLIGVYSKPGEGALALTFEGYIDGGELKADNVVIEVKPNEHSDYRYFDIQDLPVEINPPIKPILRDLVYKFNLQANI